MLRTWSILFSMGYFVLLIPTKNHPYRVSNYYQYHSTLNFDEITFPVKVKNIPKFEKINPEISVNVSCWIRKTKATASSTWVPNVIVVIMSICFFFMMLTRNTTCGSKIFPVSSPVELNTLLVEPVLSATAVSTYFHHSESWIPTSQISFFIPHNS